MAVTTNQGSTISAEAYDLLGCFTDEFSDLIYARAEEHAKSRRSVGRAGGVLVEAADIKYAVEAFRQAISRLLEDRDLPDALATEVKQMLTCFERSASECDE